MGGEKSLASSCGDSGGKQKTACIGRGRNGQRHRCERRGTAHAERTVLSVRVRMALMIRVLVSQQRTQVGIAGNDTQAAVGSQTRHVAGRDEEARQHQR